MKKVVVFLLRGCSTGWLGCYGNEWVGTPQCDRLAYEGVVWDRFYADLVDPWIQRQRLIPLLQAWRTAGVSTVLVRAHSTAYDFPPLFYESWSTLFEARPQQGHAPLRPFLDLWPRILEQLAHEERALLWIDIGCLLPPWDVPQDVFTAYLDLEESAAGDVRDEAQRAAAGGGEQPAKPAPQAGEVDSDDDQTIPPCTEPPIGVFDTQDDAAWQWLQASFAAVVTTLDAALGEAWDLLRQSSWGQEATWILTADLGFPLGEHGRIGWDRPWLHEEVVHLPLIVRLPQAQQGGRRVRALCQAADLWTTLAEWFATPILWHFPGKSLLPLLQTGADQLRQEVVSYWEMPDAAEASLRTPDWAFLLPLRIPEGEQRLPQLYAKPEDRWEVNDLRSRHLEQAEACEARLHQLLPELLTHVKQLKNDHPANDNKD
ncbi:MAG: hypothetical protein NZU63_02520 [Gemmataceae bacterium]|nr:hypothetical protein [Gemmataceae bacterium]MDW8242673.1 hypothetical protein [Thermogemmata sp.]